MCTSCGRQALFAQGPNKVIDATKHDMHKKASIIIVSSSFSTQSDKCLNECWCFELFCVISQIRLQKTSGTYFMNSNIIFRYPVQNIKFQPFLLRCGINVQCLYNRPNWQIYILNFLVETNIGCPSLLARPSVLPEWAYCKPIRRTPTPINLLFVRWSLHCQFASFDNIENWQFQVTDLFTFSDIR